MGNKTSHHFKFLNPSLTFKGNLSRFLPLNNGSLKGRCKFNSNCKYDHENDSNDSDINKLIGIKKSINTFKESAMIGWRYNAKNELFELFPYFHFTSLKQPFKNNALINVGTRNAYTERYPVFTVKENEWFDFEVSQSLDEYFIQIGDWKENYQKGFEIRKWIEINPWFGGDESPTQYMKIDFELI
jgi:hypothetical protein